jgi:hypothetical protein
MLKEAPALFFYFLFPYLPAAVAFALSAGCYLLRQGSAWTGQQFAT